MSAFLTLVARDLRLSLRQGGDAAMVIAFFVLTVVLFPFGVGPEPELLQRIAAGVVWVTALLAALLSLERLFRGDYEDGTLEQLFVSPQPVSLLVAGKLLAQYLVIGLPLTVLAPVLGAGYGMDLQTIGVLVASLLLGLPALVLTAGFASALVVGLPRTGVLLPVLVLPLVCPVVIFGAGAVRAAESGSPVEAPLYFLAAILVLCGCGVPLAAAAALRNALE